MKDIIPLTKALPTKGAATLKVDMQKYMDAAANLIEQATRAEIVDEKSYATGGDLIKVARTQKASAEEHRLRLVKPFGDLVKFINAAFKLPAADFEKAKSAITQKMMDWKKEEDRKRAAEAAEAAKILEEEALARAALEEKEEDQDEVMNTAAVASEELVKESAVGLTRGDFGSSTGTQKMYSTRIDNSLDFLRAIIKHIDDGNKRNIKLDSLVSFQKGYLNRLAKDMYLQGVKKIDGAEFIESENLRVY